MRYSYLFLLLLCLDQVVSLSWLSMGLSGARVDRNKVNYSCKNMKGMNRRQIRFCKQYPLLMDSIRMGAISAFAECQFQFHRRRWNCSIVDPISKEVSGIVLNAGTRESAFVHAISAAGVAYKVTRDCARGLNGDHCGCDHSNKQGYKHMGCSDHVQYGIGISREFVDAAERTKNNTKAAINLHNNRAGRQVLEKSLRRECKCHGMSGSCEMKTCWDTMPTFREVGMLIKDKFDGASEVSLVEEDDANARIVMKNSQFKRHTHADLVYMIPSPDYCDADVERGILGTKGRECNATSQGVDGCQLLCCNRGFQKVVNYVDDMCNCKFHYCCRVDCEPCKRKVEKYFCL